VSRSQINLSWNDPGEDKEGYKVYYSNGNYIDSTSSTSYQVTNLNCSTNYCFYVTAYKGSLESAHSDTRCATTQDCPPADTEPPIVNWIAPVGNEQVYHVGNEVIQLEVSATDNVAVDRVRFYRWDAVNGRDVEIANDYTAPYRVSLDCGTLNYEWNQINAEAYDVAGNRSDRKIIWLYRDRPATAPTADFDAWPLSGNAPLTVRFHNTSSGNYTSCYWEYGDGHTGTTCDSYHDHTYTNAGSYTVRLTVTGPGGSNTRTRTNYINVGVPPDTIAPDGEITCPSEGETILSSRVHLCGWAQDNAGGSGLQKAHFTAYYSGSWRQIGPDFTSSPFEFDWDMCNDGVPNGQVTLGLDIWDNAGNVAYSPRGNRHFIKDFNCPSNCLIESQHPYPDNYNHTWTITNPDSNATASMIHFSSLETETGYDFVIVMDAWGHEMQRISGCYPSGLWSNVVRGSTVQVQFTSDSSVNGWGFCVDRIITSGGQCPPGDPYLYTIDNADGDGSYLVHWSAPTGSTLTTLYTLQEDDNASFWHPDQVYQDIHTLTQIAGRSRGTYYYRVKAANGGCESNWSNVRSVTVSRGATSTPAATPTKYFIYLPIIFKP
jgi:PKD repeat protein